MYNVPTLCTGTTCCRDELTPDSLYWSPLNKLAAFWTISSRDKRTTCSVYVAYLYLELYNVISVTLYVSLWCFMFSFLPSFSLSLSLSLSLACLLARSLSHSYIVSYLSIKLLFGNLIFTTVGMVCHSLVKASK